MHNINNTKVRKTFISLQKFSQPEREREREKLVFVVRNDAQINSSKTALPCSLEFCKTLQTRPYFFLLCSALRLCHYCRLSLMLFLPVLLLCFLVLHQNSQRATLLLALFFIKIWVVRIFVFGESQSQSLSQVKEFGIIGVAF